MGYLAPRIPALFPRTPVRTVLHSRAVDVGAPVISKEWLLKLRGRDDPTNRAVLRYGR